MIRRSELMATSSSVQEITLHELSHAYCDAFRKYVGEGSEAELEQAYELGRALLAQGVGVLGMAGLQHTALAQLFEASSAASPLRADLEKIKLFFAESFSPYELAHGSYRECIATLRQMNESLEQIIHRLAHTVHDEAGQLLVGAHLAVSQLGHDLGPDAGEHVQRVHDILDQVEQQLRRLSHELRPTILDDLGLVPALRFLAEGVARRSGLCIEVHSSLATRCPPRVEVALYRIAQEALNNVNKHAHACQVRIDLLPVSDGIECRISDDGVGFDTQSVNSGPRRGLGLLGVQERLAALGGSLNVDSTPAHGTRLVLSIPREATCQSK
jgi:signal transduction histidine kinase